MKKILQILMLGVVLSVVIDIVGNSLVDASSMVGLWTVPNGGTGLKTLTANGVIIGNGTSPPTFATDATTTHALCGGSPPSFGTTCTPTAPPFASLTAASGNVFGPNSFGGSAGSTFDPTVTNRVELTFQTTQAASSCQFFMVLLEQII